MELKPNDTELRDTKTRKERQAVHLSKKAIITIIVSGICLLSIIIGLVVINISNKKKTERYSQLLTDNYNSPSVSWVVDFASGNLGNCDMLTPSTKDKIQNFPYIESSEYYLYAMTELGKTITNIEVLSHTGNEYTIQVTYTPFINITELDTSGIDFSDEKQKYIDGEVGDSDIQSTFAGYYDKIFKDSCFKPSDTTQTKVLTLSEEKTEDGVTYVQGTVSFIQEFLTDSNLTNNINLYENQIDQTIKQIIKK